MKMSELTRPESAVVYPQIFTYNLYFTGQTPQKNKPVGATITSYRIYQTYYDKQNSQSSFSRGGFGHKISPGDESFAEGNASASR